MNQSNGNRAHPIIQFFSRPAVGIAGSLASIVGIALSVYFFLASRETPELTYFVHPAKAAVVRTGQTSRLSVQFEGQNLAADVTAAQIAFWNAGRKPIRGAAILKPLIIRTSDKGRILEAKLRKVSRDVVALTVDTSRLSSGEVEIRWNILEQNDGGVLQLVYAGNEVVDIHAEAVVEGQPDIVRLNYSEALSTPGEDYPRRQERKGQMGGYLMLAMGLLATTLSGWLFSRTRRRGQPMLMSEWMDWVMLLQGPMLLAMGIWLVFINRPPGPPFGF